MKTLKQILEETKEVKESITSIPAVGPVMGNAKFTQGDPPYILMMRRVSIRQYPNGEKVALYKIDKIDKYITVPYSETV